MDLDGCLLLPSVLGCCLGFGCCPLFVPSFPFWIDVFSMILLFYSSKEVEDGGGGFIMICMVMDAFYLVMAMMMQGDGILR